MKRGRRCDMAASVSLTDCYQSITREPRPRTLHHYTSVARLFGAQIVCMALKLGATLYGLLRRLTIHFVHRKTAWIKKGLWSDYTVVSRTRGVRLELPPPHYTVFTGIELAISRFTDHLLDSLATPRPL